MKIEIPVSLVVGLALALLLLVPVVLALKVCGLAIDADAEVDSLPYRAVIPGVQRESDDPTEDAIRAQLPTVMPTRDEPGWPMHALTGGITWARIGELERATAWADEFWTLRDPESGLWVNQMGYIDMANPWLATRLFVLVGDVARARETSQNVVAFSRNRIDTQGVGAYNAHFFGLLSAVVVGEPMDAEQLALLAPGFEGYYSPLDTEPTPKGRYYSDIMRAYWNVYGLGEAMPLLTDESEYCPTLQGAAECVQFYRWARGEPAVPDLGGEPYSFYTDGIILYALKGVEP